MSQSIKPKICNRTLGCILILMLASGIQLEATSGEYDWSVWCHIALGLLLCLASVYHIYLHYKTGNWFSRFARNRNRTTRILWWTFLLTAVSGIAATVVWIVDEGHSPLGGVHGKIGFIMAVIAVVHVVGHKSRRRASGSK